MKVFKVKGEDFKMLKEMLTENLITLNLKAQNKEEAINELIEMLFNEKKNKR